MNGHDIHTGADLRAQALDFLQREFGKSGTFYYWIARGVDERPVRADRIRKSIGAENTFFEDLREFETMRDALQPIVDKVWHHCEQTGTRARTVTLKVKFADFEQITRRHTVAETISSPRDLHQIAVDLLRGLVPLKRQVRLLGVTLSSLDHGEDQPSSQMSFEL